MLRREIAVGLLSVLAVACLLASSLTQRGAGGGELSDLQVFEPLDGGTGELSIITVPRLPRLQILANRVCWKECNENFAACTAAPQQIPGMPVCTKEQTECYYGTCSEGDWNKHVQCWSAARDNFKVCSVGSPEQEQPKGAHCKRLYRNHLQLC